MEEEILANPDYQLVMSFLQSIRPGDMSPEAANQLIAIGQRIQGGGVLTDREREMFTAVVGNISQKMPEQQMSYGVDGKAVPLTQNQYGTEVQSGNITPDLPSADGMTYGPSSGVTVDPNVMDMQQMIDAVIINPERPPMRPKNLGGR